MSFLNVKYKTSIDIEHFLKNINIMSYVQDYLAELYQLEKKLELLEDDPVKRLEKLIVQLALLAFEFKKGRRVTIKCL